MEELDKRLAELIDQLKQPAAEAILKAAQVQSYSVIVGGLIAVVFCIVLVIGARMCWTNYQENTTMNDGFALGAFALSIFAGIAAIIASMCLLDPWTWYVIFEPELYVAKKLLGM